MKYINNRKIEPSQLTEYRETTPNATYDGLGTDVKDIIRDSLLDEQGYICAYCMCRIDNSSECTIEHYISQRHHSESPFSEDEHKRQSLLYSNMSGVCKNNSEHCDKHRGNTPLEILDPHKPSCEELISYDFNGHIKPSGRDIEKVQKDICTLGLDCDKLVEFRRTVWDEIWGRFKKKHERKDWSRELFLEYAQKYRTKERKRHDISRFHAYCNFIVWGFEYYAENYKQYKHCIAK